MNEPDAPDQHLLECVLAASPDCVKALSADGTILFMNARGLELNDLVSEDQVRGANLIEMWPPAEREKIAEAIRGAAAGALTSFEGYCPTATGRPRWWEVRFAPIVSQQGGPLRIAGISRDISDRRQAELTARANAEKFSLLLESSGDGIYGMALDGRCTFINRSGASMLGYAAKTLIGRSLHEIVHHHRVDGSAYPVTECEIYKAAQLGTSRRVDDEVFWHQDGHPIPVTYSVFPMILDGIHMGAVVTYSDTTKRRQVEQDLRRFAAELSEADRRKTEFLATLAHELRNPLAPLSNGLKLLAKGGDSPEAIAKVRDMMQRQLAQMVHLVNDLLDIARISSGKMELQTELVDLAHVVGIAVEACTPTITSHGHQLSVDLQKDALLLRADVTRLTQVFSNILNNAAKYTPPGGRIILSARALGGCAEIRISDTGIGIAAGSLGAVFEMFTQVGRDLHTVPGGLGIGLNLVRRLVDLHDGTVTAASDGINQGSTFTVRLPLATAQPVGIAVAAGEDPARHALQILVVDDNCDAAQSLAMLMSMDGHTALVAENGAEALRIVTHEFHPHLVFLDIGMPVLNGYEVAREMRKLPGFDKVIMVALTGWGGQDDRKRSLAAGFDQHLTKPVDFEAVERLLSQVRRSAL